MRTPNLDDWQGAGQAAGEPNERMSKSSKSIRTAALLAVGVLLLLLSILMLAESRSRTANGLLAEGTVLRNEEGYTGSGKHRTMTYRAVIQFETASGEVVEIRSYGNKAPLYKKGERLSVLYDPRTPRGGQIHSFGVLWAPPIILAIGGVLLMLFAGRRSIVRLARG